MSTMRAEIKDAVEQFHRSVKNELGSALRSLTLVGSAVTNDFVNGKSDINSVLVLESIDMQVLSVLARIGPSLGRKRLRAPLLMTPSYISSSCDVFAVEWLDFQAFHHTVEGPDPFRELTFDKQHVRLQCEKQFKVMQIHLRQGYISSGENKNVLGTLLAAVAKDMLPYLRALLWLDDSSRDAHYQATFEQVRSRFSVDMSAFEKAFAFRYARLHESAEHIRNLFRQADEAINELSRIADQWSI